MSCVIRLECCMSTRIRSDILRTCSHEAVSSSGDIKLYGSEASAGRTVNATRLKKEERRSITSWKESSR